jgi:hypothetical protein
MTCTCATQDLRSASRERRPRNHDSSASDAWLTEVLHSGVRRTSGASRRSACRRPEPRVSAERRTPIKGPAAALVYVRQIAPPTSPSAASVPALTRAPFGPSSSASAEPAAPRGARPVEQRQRSGLFDRAGGPTSVRTTPGWRRLRMKLVCPNRIVGSQTAEAARDVGSTRGRRYAIAGAGGQIQGALASAWVRIG